MSYSINCRGARRRTSLSRLLHFPSLDSRALKTLSKLTSAIDPALTSLREARAHALKLLAAENLRQLEVFTDSPSERRVLRDFIASAADGLAAQRQPVPVA